MNVYSGTGTMHIPIIAGRDKTWAFLVTLRLLRGLDDKLEAIHDSRMMGKRFDDEGIGLFISALYSPSRAFKAVTLLSPKKYANKR